ncbi:hypothetical protein B0T13DRAFT_488002 [Neurospora crassa]|nr:hypothetical protein B0T13DRAFT_488002 [Neurospora crassa]
MEPWLQGQANAAGGRPTPLDGRASYHHWTGIFNGQLFTYHHLAALFPERYAPHSGERFPWHCPVVGCHAVHQFAVELAGHFTVAHLSARLLDNRNGTFSNLGPQDDPRGFAFVAAQRQTPLGWAAPFQFGPPSETSSGAATPVPENADDNPDNGVAEPNDGSESDQWRDSGISMAATSEDSDDDDDDDDDDDLPAQTIQIPTVLPAAQAPVPFPSLLVLRTIHDHHPRQELPDPTPLELEIWPYITRWTLYPLPIPSPSTPAHRTLLALLSFPRIRTLPVSWQERLLARTPSLGTLTAIALYLGGRAEFGSPCQSHCGQHGALVERLFTVQREEAWENGLGHWKFEKKFAFPRCVKVPGALEGDLEVEEVLGGRPCCNHFFRELRGAWETGEPFPPRPPGGLVWNGPMW